MEPAWLEAVSTLLAAIAAAVSVVVAVVVWRGQVALDNRHNELTKELEKQRTAFETKLNSRREEFDTELNNRREEFETKLQEEERKFARRSQLIPLWQYMSSVNRVNCAVPRQVVDMVNKLELIALCWEAGITDPALIRRTFAMTFLEIYDDIDKCPALPGVGKTGRQLLLENRATMKLYETLKKEHIAAGEITP